MFEFVNCELGVPSAAIAKKFLPGGVLLFRALATIRLLVAISSATRSANDIANGLIGLLLGAPYETVRTGRRSCGMEKPFLAHRSWGMQCSGHRMGVLHDRVFGCAKRAAQAYTMAQHVRLIGFMFSIVWNECGGVVAVGL